MTWNCPDCGFRDNEDAALRCSCGHEISLIEPNSANAEVITATHQMPLLDQVKAELAQASGQKTLLQKASVLVLSLFLFATLGLFETSLSGVIVLLIVLFIHEAGHLFGMKLFGYRDVQVFFIPFLGAAASGTEINPSSTRKAIVSLLGPIPGIILGIIAAFFFFKTKEDFFAQCASTFLFINGFNLLPFHPLDGGRFFEYLIFSRKPLYEIGFKVVTCLILVGLAFILKAPLLGLFAFAVLVTLKNTAHSANIAHKLRNDDLQKDLKSHQIPDIYFIRIINEVKNIVGVDINNTKTTAKLVLDIWNRTCNKPSGIGNTAALIGIYLIFMALGIITPFAFETSKIISMTKTEMVSTRDIHGTPILLEVRSYKGYKLSEIVVRNGMYDGPATNWYLSSENKSKEGTWKNGYWHGEWKFWNKKGEMESITYYERGRPIRYAVVKAGARVDIPADKWPLPVKQSFQTKPEGPKLKKGE